VEMYRRGLKVGVEFSHTLAPSEYERVLIIGMGGSGIVGEIVSSLAEKSATQVETFKTIKLPQRLGRNVLVIAVSYSGDTAETNWAFFDAFSRDAKVVGVSTGGRLTTAMKMRGLPVLPVTSGLQPRFAVPEMVGIVYGILSRFEGFSEKLFMKSVDELESYAKNFSNPFPKEAVEPAEAMIDKPVVAIGPDILSAALTRFKCQLNENAKHPCYTSVVPEAFHNEIEGWTMADRFTYFFVRSGHEHPMVSEALDWCEEYLRTAGAVVRRSAVSSSSFQAEVLKQVLFGDLISLALARLKKIDPTLLKTIPMLRPTLRKYLP
ncbi:MAG: hypothetical protein N3H84_07380, partial [Candidatus Caldarchaeum sp.]|nr:hypothetical protein [Candidatus Caldarchaeum sp.]